MADINISCMAMLYSPYYNLLVLSCHLPICLLVQSNAFSRHQLQPI